MTKWAIFDNIEKWKSTMQSQKMTKLSIFDKIEEANKSTVLSENDKIQHIWQNWRSEKIKGSLRKWQNWAFLTKTKKRKNPRASHKMTKLSIFDKIEETKKYTGFSENDKIKHFWQNWRSEKIHGPLTKWQNWAFLTKLKKRKNTRASHKMTKWSIFDKNSLIYQTHSVHIIYLCLSHNLKSTFQKWSNGPFLTKLKKWKKKYTFLSQKMTKLSIFDKIEKAKKI